MTTISLELAKRLYNKGLRIETEKCWQRDSLRDSWKIIIYKVRGEYHIEYLLPAYSTDELLAVMPSFEYSSLLWIRKEDRFGRTFYQVEYREPKDTLLKNEIRHGEYEFSLSETLGKMCLWLLEHGWRWDNTNKLLVKGEG